MSQVQLEKVSGAAEPILEVRDLVVTFEKSTGMVRVHKKVISAVDHVSLNIFEGEFLALVGETGSGKTTVARCLLGVTPPTSGSIRYNGVDISRFRGRKLRVYHKEVQFVFQDPFESLLSRHSILGNIAIPIRYLTGEKNPEKIREIAAGLLVEVGLKPEIMNRYPHQLSGGERQRVNIARALASNPKILIADEPITMLDAAQRLNILSLLISLKAKRKLTLLMITHDLASAVIVSDRILVMYAGKLVESGPARALFSAPIHPYVELILASAPNIKAPLGSPDEKTTLLSVTAERSSRGCVFEPRCKYATAICREVEPPLREVKASRHAACHNPLDSQQQE